MWKRETGGGWSKFGELFILIWESRIWKRASSQWIFSNEVKRSSSSCSENLSRLKEEFKNMQKPVIKLDFSTLMGRGVEETQWKKLKFLSYFWKTFLNLWEILFLSATKSHNCSWIIRGRMFSCIGNDKRLPFINSSAAKACRVTTVFLIVQSNVNCGKCYECSLNLYYGVPVYKLGYFT